MLTGIALASVVVLAQVPGSVVAVRTIPAQPGPCQAGWQEVPVQASAFESTPFEILTVKGQPAWVVGGTNDGPLVLRWRSGRWEHVARYGSGHRGFVGATVTGKGRILAVGYERQPISALDPYVGWVRAGRFRLKPPPTSLADQATLADVALLRRGGFWAVGTGLYRGKSQALASRWDGSRWRQGHPASGRGAGLLAVERAPGGTVWAAGWREAAAGRPKPLALRRAGGRWKEMPMPTLRGTAVLTDITFVRAGLGYALGYQVPFGGDRHRPVLFRWDGKRWTSVELPWADDASAVPRAIAASPDGDIWIGGARLANESREARGFIAHRARGAWDVAVIGVPDDVRSEITGVAVTRAGAIATATVAGSALVLRTCTPATEPAASRRRIRVGDVPARRSTGGDDEPAVATATGPSAASASPAGRLEAPVSLPSFVVRDRTARAGLKAWTPTYGGFAADLDGDGRRDLFIGRHSHIPLVLMNRPEGLERLAGAARRFSLIDRHGCDAADIDGSGSLDILCVTGRGKGKHLTRHELTLDPGAEDGRLDRTTAGIADPFGRGRTVTFIELDGDGNPDVFIGTAPGRDDAMPGPNRFYRNTGGAFRAAPEVGLDRAHGAICAWSGDIDRDGDEDLAYCSAWPRGDVPAGLRLMRNEGGKLVDRTRALGITPMGDVDVAFADVTGDGYRDLVQLSRSRISVSRWDGSHYVRVWGAAISEGVAIATGDADGDGRADIYVARGRASRNKPDRLLVSRGHGRRFVSVRIPTTTRGAPDDVISLDLDENGHADFVVLNGGGKPGPVKLLASYPR